MSDNIFQSQKLSINQSDFNRTFQPPTTSQMLYQDDILNQYKSNLKTPSFNHTINERHLSNSLKHEQEPSTFEVFITMKIKSNDAEDRNEQMKLTMITSYSKKQTIQIQLTSPQDPLILYILEMGDIEFHNLKDEQSLIMDFQSFPNSLMTMLERCINDKNQTHICILHKRNPTEALLILQERTQFRELSHLILNLQQANDTMVKRYLGALSSEYKSKYELACNSLEKQNMDIDSLQSENMQLKEQIQKDKMIAQSSIDNLLNEKNKELNQLKEKSFVDTKTKLDELEQIKNAKITELDGKILEIQRKYEELHNDKKGLDEYKMKLEMNHRDLEGKHAISNTELNVYKNDIANLRQDNSALNQKCFKQEKEITELKFMNDTLQKQLEEKEKNMTNLNQLVETLTKQIEGHEDTIKTMKANNSKLTEKLETSVKEIVKGNEVIEQIQAKLKSQKTNVKDKQQALVSQTELTAQKQMLLDEQIRLVNELKRSNELKENDIASLNKQVSTYQQKLHENEKLIDDNKHMIMYLNQKLNDNYNPFTSNYPGSNTNGFQATMQKPPMSMNSGFNTNTNNNLGNYTNYSSDPLSTSNNNNNNNCNNNNYLQSSSGSGMLIMPETNFCNYKPNNQKIENKYMNNNIGNSTSGTVNLLNHKYGMMSSMSKNNNLDGSASATSMTGYRNEESNPNINKIQRTYNMDEEFPRQLTQPQRTMYQQTK